MNYPISFAASLVARERIVASRFVNAFAVTAAVYFSVASASAQTLYVTSDRTVAGGNPINTSGFPTVVVGRNAANANFFGVNADVTGGVSTTLRLFNDSDVNLNAGRFDGGTSEVNGTSVLTINQSNIGGIDANEDGRIIVNDGEIDDLDLNDFGTGLINGGFLGSVSTNSRSELSIINGALVSLTANTNSEVTMTGGTIQDNVRIEESSIIDILAGTIGDASSDQFTVDNNARLNFTNGNMSGSLRTRNNARTTILDGSFAAAIRGNDLTSLTSIYGGTFGSLASANGKFDLYGIGITFTNPRTGTYSDTFGSMGGGVYWDLTGTLSNGDALNATYFEDNASLGSAPANLRILAPAIIPELGTASLALTAVALLAGVAVRRNVRRQA